MSEFTPNAKPDAARPAPANGFPDPLAELLGDNDEVAADFPYYNTVDQIYHAEWSTAKLAKLALLRESIDTLWPNGHPT
ncbi:MAG: hypothetical protein WDZ49_17460, partial [Litorilinea sp.]